MVPLARRTWYLRGAFALFGRSLTGNLRYQISLGRTEFLQFRQANLPEEELCRYGWRRLSDIEVRLWPMIFVFVVATWASFSTQTGQSRTSSSGIREYGIRRKVTCRDSRCVQGTKKDKTLLYLSSNLSCCHLITWEWNLRYFEVHQYGRFAKFDDDPA